MGAPSFSLFSVTPPLPSPPSSAAVRQSQASPAANAPASPPAAAARASAGASPGRAAHRAARRGLADAASRAHHSAQAEEDVPTESTANARIASRGVVFAVCRVSVAFTRFMFGSATRTANEAHALSAPRVAAARRASATSPARASFAFAFCRFAFDSRSGGESSRAISPGSENSSAFSEPTRRACAKTNTSRVSATSASMTADFAAAEANRRLRTPETTRQSAVAAARRSSAGA